MTPDEIRKTIDEAWPRPWSYDTHGMVFAANGSMVCQLRGWGRLTGRGGGMALDPHDAADVQDCLGLTIVGEHEHAQHLGALLAELRTFVKTAEAYMQYHAEKFYEGRPAPEGLWPAIESAKTLIAKVEGRS